MDYGERLQDTDSIESITRQVQRLEAAGIDAAWFSETVRDPYMTVAVAAGATSRIMLGTGIAVAFARSPYSTALSAWYAQRLSGGRFRLGLSTQVKAHIERRYGMQWRGGAGVLRDYIATCAAVWHAWQTGARPDHVGEFYQFTLTNPEFSPDPLPPSQAHIPLWVAAVGGVTAKLAGEVADGVHVHAFHTPGYLRDVVIRAAQEGRAAAGRSDPVSATCPVFAGIAHDDHQASVLRDQFREYIAFYASTPAYLPLLEHEGVEEVHAPLRGMAREGRWDEMPALIGDDLVDRFVLVDEPVALARQIKSRYAGLLTEVGLYRGGARFADTDDMGLLVEELAGP